MFKFCSRFSVSYTCQTFRLEKKCIEKLKKFHYFRLQGFRFIFYLKVRGVGFSFISLVCSRIEQFYLILMQVDDIACWFHMAKFFEKKLTFFLQFLQMTIFLQRSVATHGFIAFGIQNYTLLSST